VFDHRCHQRQVEQVRRNGLPQPPAGAGDSSTLGMILNRRIMMQSPGRPKFGSYASSLQVCNTTERDVRNKGA